MERNFCQRKKRFSQALPFKILPIKLFYGNRDPCHASHIFAAKNYLFYGDEKKMPLAMPPKIPLKKVLKKKKYIFMEMRN